MTMALLKQAEEQTMQAKGRRFFDRKFKLTRDLYAFWLRNMAGSGLLIIERFFLSILI